jgi:deoxyribonuclease V
MHPWDLRPEAAMALQTKLACRVIGQSRLRPEGVMTVAGVDTGYRDGIAHAAVVVVNLKDLKTVEKAVAARAVTYPYIPGLLSFREGPVILEALEKLEKPPDLLMIDGQGIAHPRRCGIASHIGVLQDIPTIGCAKTRLVGDYEEPQRTRVSTSLLKDGKETIGAAVRTRTGVKPVYVSIGHLINLADSIRVVLQSCRGYRLPEPLRRADHLSRKEK